LRVNANRPLFQHAAEGVVVGQLRDLEEALRLVRDLLQQLLEALFVELVHDGVERLLLPALRQHFHHVLVVADHVVGERGEPAVLEVDDAVGDVEDAVVVGDHQDGRALLLGQHLHALDHLAPRLLVERGRGLVRQQDLRLGRERARDRHALALAAGQGLALVIEPLAEPDRLQHGARAPAARPRGCSAA
jgi:hypothetical protein